MSTLESFFFFNDTATTEIYPLSLHDALPISQDPLWAPDGRTLYFAAETRGNIHLFAAAAAGGPVRQVTTGRSEEHTSELQSLAYLVCRLLLEKKNDDRQKKEQDVQ